MVPAKNKLPLLGIELTTQNYWFKSLMQKLLQST